MRSGKWIVMLILLVLLAFSASANLSPLVITDRVRGTTVSFFEEYFIVNQNGTLIIENPTALDLYEFRIDLYLSTLQFEPVLPDGNSRWQYGILAIDEIPANTSYVINYRLYGITTDKDLVYQKSAIITSMIRGSPTISMQNIGTLMKAPLEDAGRGGRDRTRVISARYFNPTYYDFLINEVNIIKTDSLDLSRQLNKWTFVKENPILGPFEEWNIDILDTDAVEGEIYWLSTDIEISGIDFFQRYNVTFLTERDLYMIPDNMTNATDDIFGLDFLIDRLYVSKRISQTVVVPGDEIDVVILINNFVPNDVKNVTVYDIVPPGFEIINPSGGLISDREVRWESVILNSQETRRISYRLKYNDEDSFGLDFFEPVTVAYGRKEVKSEAVPFVRKYIPEKKIFLQKKIRFMDDDNVKVTLELQNFGESPVEHLVLNEYLAPESEFKEVTQEFTSKGVWKIPRIDKGSRWEVSYTTDSVGVLNTFPIIYGIESKSVMKTIILSNLIKSEYSAQRIRMVEIGGIAGVLIIMIIFFLPKGFFRFGKRSELKEIRKIKGELSNLKEATRKKDEPHKTEIASSLTPATTRTAIRQPSEKEAMRESMQKEMQQIQGDADLIKKKLGK